MISNRQRALEHSEEMMYEHNPTRQPNEATQRSEEW